MIKKHKVRKQQQLAKEHGDVLYYGDDDHERLHKPECGGNCGGVCFRDGLGDVVPPPTYQSGRLGEKHEGRIGGTGTETVEAVEVRDLNGREEEQRVKGAVLVGM